LEVALIGEEGSLKRTCSIDYKDQRVVIMNDMIIVDWRSTRTWVSQM